MTVRAVKVKGEKLRFLAHADSAEQLVTGATTGATPTGWNFKVKGAYVYWVDDDGAERSKLGTLTGESRTFGDITVHGEDLYFGDEDGNERYISAALIASSDDKTHFNGQGSVRATRDVTYLTVHNEAGSARTHYNEYHTVGQRYNENNEGKYQIHRAIMRFDLTDLPPGTSIDTAVMSILPSNHVYHHTAWNFTLVDGSDCSDPLVTADYGDLLDDTTSLGSIAVSTITESTRFEITLNAAGKAFLESKAGGVAVIAVRSSDDISSIAPTGDWNAGEKTEVNFAIISSTNYPYITITY